uniref:Transcription factor IIIC 90kDa subunit N-terminal domain-containing protein n=1 Tax=Clastoptera arizonana TaxID=38151 RepID=A0A1B6CKU8_9HEMI
MRVIEVQSYSVSNLVNNAFASSWSDDNKMAVIHDKGVHILALTPNPHSVLASLSCSRYSIKTDSSFPCSDLGIDLKKLIWNLDKDDVYKLLLDTSLSPILPKTEPINPNVKQVAWSPIIHLKDQECLLSVLTDMGSLIIYRLMNMTWVNLTSISELWIDHCKKKWSSIDTLSLKEEMAELERRGSHAKITAMCWSCCVYNNSVLFFTATKAGEISFWRIGRALKIIKTNLLHSIQSDLQMIVKVHWFSIAENAGFLLVASLEGLLKCYTIQCGTNTSDFKIKDTYSIWSERDRLKVSYMDVWKCETGELLVFVKEAFVLVFLLESTGKPVCHAVHRCSDIKISSISRVNDNSILMTTCSGRVCILYINLIKNKLQLTSQQVDNNFNLSHMACYGASLSRNKVICGIVLSANQAFDHLILRDPSQIILGTLPEIVKPLSFLQTSNESLCTMWDFLEVLRVQTIQKTFVPEIESKRAVLDTLSVGKLTLLLWMISFKLAAEEDELKLSRLKNLRNEVEILVLSCHFFKRTAILLSLENTLTLFQLQSLGLIKKWLQNLSNLDAEYSSTLTTASSLLEQVQGIQNIPSIELCSICNSEIPLLNDHYYSLCVNGHKIPRCSLSLIQCNEVPYFICGQCGVLAHSLSVEDFKIMYSGSSLD